MIVARIAYYLLIMYAFMGSSYYLFFALTFYIVNLFNKGTDTKCDEHSPNSRFVIIIPAHNEEHIIPRLLKSVKSIHYPEHLYDTYVICDNCDDSTEQVCRSMDVKTLSRTDTDNRGKGYAIRFALERINIRSFNGVLMVDADTVLDKDILNVLDVNLEDESKSVFQCHNAVLNPEDSLLTNLMVIARSLEMLTMGGRSAFGLAVHLIGNGMCFRPSVFKLVPWESYSISEDLEYFCMLSRKGVKVHFIDEARIYLHEEDRFAHAETQRQRWSTGKIRLMTQYAPKLFFEGLVKLNFVQVELTSILILPNPSTLGNIVLVCLILLLIIPVNTFIMFTAFVPLVFLALFFFLGILNTGRPIKYIRSILIVPKFLVWKAFIDFKALFFDRDKTWKKTKRHRKIK